MAKGMVGDNNAQVTPKRSTRHGVDSSLPEEELRQARADIISQLRLILRQEATVRGVSASFSGVRRQSDYVKVRFEGEDKALEALLERLGEILPALHLETLSRVEYENSTLHTLIVTEHPGNQDIFPDDKRHLLQDVLNKQLFVQPVSLKTRVPILSDTGEVLTNDGEIIYNHPKIRRRLSRAQRKRLLIIDNYDSFTYNLVQHLGALGAELSIWRNDAFELHDIVSLDPDGIIVSPGPCTPREAGKSIEVIQEFGKYTPILGVCLGHQSIGAAYGAKVVRAHKIMHGKISHISHDGSGIFERMPNSLPVTRYHSLIIEDLPEELLKNAWVDDDGREVIMGVQHSHYPVWGVQFHPESILTEDGEAMLSNFLNIC